ncbi:MAG: DUF294 nucleotidyltransferase-like domain-containing protein [Parachlamydia sp.]|nr:DUF294 nucleotidyltransferase-like domain-containing protein [Parachlamydia sp.]
MSIGNDLKVNEIIRFLEPVPQANELSCEELLERGLQEKIRGEFAKALCSLEKGLIKSEQEKKFPVLIRIVELIGDLFLEQKNYLNAAKIYACCLALLKPPEGASQTSRYFVKLKDVEQAYLTSTRRLMRQSERLSSDQLKTLQAIQLSKFPASCRELASEIKTKLADIHYMGEHSKHYLEASFKKFLNLSLDSADKISENRLKQILELMSKAEFSDPSRPQSIVKYRENLYTTRKVLADKCDQRESPSHLTEYTTEILLHTFKDIIFQCLAQMTQPPCQFAIVGLGSMAKGEMTPYSHVEFAILIEKDGQEIRSFFIALSELIELKIIQLGETPFPLLRRGQKSPVGEGFRVDSGGNTPLCEIVSLLATPEKLASYQLPFYFQEQYLTTVNALRDSCFVYGSSSLYEAYATKVKEILSRPSKTTFPQSTRLKWPGSKGTSELIAPPEAIQIDPENPHSCSLMDRSKIVEIEHDARLDFLLQAIYRVDTIIQQNEETLSIGQDYAYILGKAAVKEFKPDLETKLLYQRECVVIKRELNRLPGLFVSMLALYFGIEEKNFWLRCRELVAQGKLSKENGDFLISMMDEIMRLRFESQLFYEEEREDFYLTSDPHETEKRLVANVEQLKSIRRIYQLIYPLHSVLSLFIRNRIDTNLLKAAVVYPSHSFAHEGKMRLEGADLDGALDAFKMELALKPEQPEVIQLLRGCEAVLNMRLDEEKFLNERKDNYKTKYKFLDEFMQNEHSLLQISAFIQRSSFAFKMKPQRFYDLLEAPFSILAAYLDLGIKHHLSYPISLLNFIADITQVQFPEDLAIEWYQQCMKIFVNSMQIRRTNAPTPIQGNPEEFLALDTLVTRMTRLIPREHPHYPTVEHFLYLAQFFIRQGNRDKTRYYLKRSEQQIALVESVRRVKLSIAIYEMSSRLAFLEGKKEEARSHMATALRWAQESTYAVEIIEKRQANLEKNINNEKSQIISEQELMPLPSHEDQVMAESLVAEQSTFLTLLYFERLLARDPSNQQFQDQVSTLKLVKLLHDEACSHISALMKRQEVYKDLDHQITPAFPTFLYASDKKPLLDLAMQAPARFSLALFYGHLLSVKRVYGALAKVKGKDPHFVAVLVSITRGELQNLIKIFGTLLPKSIELEIYLNLSNLFSEWESYQDAEEFLRKAELFHQK